MNLDELRDKYLKERPDYEVLAQEVGAMLATETRRRGIFCKVDHRAKDIASFLKKALRKPYRCAYEDIHDKAGVRIVVTYADSMAEVESLVRSLFDVKAYDNKIEGHDYTRLGYMGIHFEVVLKDSIGTTTYEKCRGMICEVQLQTRAQNLWADISHPLSYKPPQEPTSAINRMIYRLCAVVEIFDDQVVHARSAMLNLEGFEEARLLDELERIFYRYAARAFDRELSLYVIRELKHTYEPHEVSGFSTLIEDFAKANQGKLEMIYADYATDDRNLLLFQPEALMAFERLGRAKFALKEAWAGILPVELLEELGGIWGLAV